MKVRTFALVWLTTAVLWSASGCGRSRGDIAGGGNSETHFLEECTDHCPGDLSCICGVCTRSCTETSDCGSLAPNAECATACTDAPITLTCDVPCGSSADCAGLMPGASCRAERCRFGGATAGAGGTGTDKTPGGSGETATGAAGSRAGGGSGGASQPGLGEAGAATLEPGACSGGVAPILFATANKITFYQIALTGESVYWNDGSAIMRASKVDGSTESVTAIGADSFGIFVDANRVYWFGTGGIVRPIYSALLADPSEALELASDAAHDGGAVSDDIVYYVSDPSNVGVGGAPSVPSAGKVVGVPSSGGEAVISVDQPPADALGPLAADSTGVYWAYNARNDRSLGAGGANNLASLSAIRKFSRATGTVSDFAPITLIAGQGLLLADGSHVVWADDRYPDPTNLWSSSLDGTIRHQLATSALVRGLASDGTYAYWAASTPGDDYSDIYRAPLAGGPAESLACHVGGIAGLAVDDTHVYFFTYFDAPTIQRLPKQPPPQERMQ